jgi:hypothetical protein
LKKSWMLLAVPALIAAAACGRSGDDAVVADTALARDLSLANQVAPNQPLDSLEAGLAASSDAAATPTRSASRTPVRRTSGSSGSSGTASSGSGTRTTATSGGEVVVKKNTKRDAIIGAAAGAAIGAATSKDKVKGAVIGGVVGGVIGGVIGNNVDVQKKRKPPQ